MEQAPRVIGVEQSVRPLRLALLVDPQDVNSIRQAISCNTGQWGGVFNPLIAVYRRRPTWWHTRLPFPEWAPTAVELADGAIESWDPDFLVECRTGPQTQPESEVPRVDIGELSSHHFDEDGPGAGTSIRLIIQLLHEDFFRFQRATGPEPVCIGGDEKLEHLAAAAFGSFGGGAGKQLESAYRDLLGATDISLDSANLLRLLGYRAGPVRLVSPLDLNAHKLSVSWPFHRRESVIFLMSTTEGIDLVDFWNLRAMGKRVIPVPIHLAESLRPQIAASIGEISGGEDRTVSVIGGRRVPQSRIDAFRQGLGKDGQILFDPGLLVWDHRLEADNLERPTVSAAQGEESVELSRDRIQIPLVRPEITARGTAPNLRAWASVVSLRPDVRADDLAGAFDPGLGMVDRLLESREPSRVQARREGLVSIVALEDRIDWRPPSGTELFGWFAHDPEAEPQLSEPGSIATEMVRRLGGLGRVGVIRHPALVELMDKGCRAETGTVKYEEVKEATMRARGGDPERAERLLSALLERRVLDIGLLLDCPRCSKQNWYPPEELAITCECSRCLEHFPFPGVRPPGRWAYKPRGGFAAPGFARGSYPVLFSLATLTEYSSRSSWWPSLSLGGDLETDFGLWSHNDPLPGRTLGEWNLFLGEAKTNTRFEEKDIVRAEALRRRFPDCVLVFSTLRAELSADEKELIARLARASDRDRAPSRANVVVLTELELYAQEGLTNAWQDAGGLAAEIAPRHMGRRPWAEAVADITQQLHLGLPRYEEWRFAEFNSRS